MAQAAEVKIGQVWTDSQGRQLQVKSGRSRKDGKYLVFNLKTGRDLRRGPGAFVRKLAAKNPTPASRGKARSRRSVSAGETRRAKKKAKKKVTKKKAVKKAVRKKNPRKKKATPRQSGAAAVARAREAFQSPWPAYDMPPPLNPAPSPFYNPPDDDYQEVTSERGRGALRRAAAARNPHGSHAEDMRHPRARAALRRTASAASPHAQNPGHYPTALTRFVAEAVATMNPATANNPATVRRVVEDALAAWENR